VSGPLIRLVLAYDGTDFSGWQVQPRRRTVQGLVQGRITEITGEAVTLHGAGRTDAGVHASGQVAHFAPPRALPMDTWRKGLNAMLPPEVRILAADEVDPSFHARKSATGKLYRYQIYVGDICPPFQHRYCHHEARALDVAAMREAAAPLVGEHDFAAFQAAGSDVKTTVRRLTEVSLSQEKSLLEVRLEGSGFLRCMVRNIVGTLLEVGRGAWAPSRVGEILGSRDRSQAGPTAPARGLFLVRVHYPEPDGKEKPEPKEEE
jgi:tRNA pseudouridine38-40 synthase